MKLSDRQIRERIDIVKIISEYVDLVEHGNDHIGSCPFHEDTAMFFSVSAANKFFHCLGCKAWGDAFAFVMYIEDVNFTAARQILSDELSMRG